MLVYQRVVGVKCPISLTAETNSHFLVRSMSGFMHRLALFPVHLEGIRTWNTIGGAKSDGA
jgi:hypothetical protein